MKKYLNLSLFYALAAMVCGVFYREFTKWKGFTGLTALGKLHTHLFILGMVVYLLVALFALLTTVEEQKSFRLFMLLYNIGLPLTTLMMLLRGVSQVLGMVLSRKMDAALSGMAGMGHILLGTGLILLLTSLKKSAKKA